MYEQMDMMQFLHGAGAFQPGEYVEKGSLGERLTFGEIANMEGCLIAIDNSTKSKESYKIVRIERIIKDSGHRRLVYYDGSKQRGMVDEMYFDESLPFPARAYRPGNGGRHEGRI